MNTLEILAQILLALAALMSGASIAKAGIVSGNLTGALDVRFLKWRFVCRVYNFRATKSYYQAAVIAA